jgi:glycosyltransferase involved in cell wall biosynthesis
MTEEAADLTIVHPWDPWSPRLGGYDTCIDGFLRYAPDSWRIEMIGVSTDLAQRSLGRRHHLQYHGRPVSFVPVMHDPDPATMRVLPLSFRFAVACRRRRIRPQGKIVQFHRFESVFAVRLEPGRRKVCFLHNHPQELVSAHSEVRWKRVQGVFLLMLDHSLKDADSVWCVDPRSTESLERKLPDLAGRVHWFPVWADPDDFDPGTESQRKIERDSLVRQLHLSGDARIVIFAGRLELQKDPLLLVDAMAKLTESRPDVELLFVGQGRLEQAILHRAARWGMEERVRIHPPVSRHKLASFYRACDVAVCSSAFESGARHVFESLACGTPVVSFDVGQARSALADLEDVGLLVERRDALSLAAGLERALACDGSPAFVARCASAVAWATPQYALSGVFGQYSKWLKTGTWNGVGDC